MRKKEETNERIYEIYFRLHSFVIHDNCMDRHMGDHRIRMDNRSMGLNRVFDTVVCVSSGINRLDI